MSPEQADGHPATAASDVFAPGSIAYEMLTGRQAFAGDNVLQVLGRIRDVRPEALAADTPEPFASPLRELLVADPAAPPFRWPKWRNDLPFPNSHRRQPGRLRKAAFRCPRRTDGRGNRVNQVAAEQEVIVGELGELVGHGVAGLVCGTISATASASR